MPTISPAPAFRTSEKLMMAGAFVLAIVIGKQFAPQESTAAPLQAPPFATTAARVTPGKLVGTFVGQQVTVRAIVTGRGIRYDVLDGSGSVVAEDLDREDLAARFPEADLTNALADGSEPAIDRATPDPR